MDNDSGDEANDAATAGAASLTALGQAAAFGQLTPQGVAPRGTLSTVMGSRQELETALAAQRLFADIRDKDGNPLSPTERHNFVTAVLSSATTASGGGSGTGFGAFNIPTPATPITAAATTTSKDLRQLLDARNVIKMRNASAAGAPMAHTSNPLKSKATEDRAEIVSMHVAFNQRAEAFLIAKEQHAAIGEKLGERMANEAKLQATSSTSTDPAVVSARATITAASNGTSVSDVRNELRAAADYMSYTEQQMWATISSTNVAYDKSSVEIIDLPKSIVPDDRKEAVQLALEWIRTPAFIKRFSTLVVDIQGMVEVMDPVTGMYMAPKQHRSVAIKPLAETQDRDLAKMLRYKIKNIEYTSLWKGSTTIGAGDHRVLYNVNPDSGLDMIYAWISQYVLIEIGTSRADLVASLEKLTSLFAEKVPMSSNESKISELLEHANEGGVTPDWLSHGLKCVRATCNKGQAYSEACNDEGLKKNSAWSRDPLKNDVTRMLLDLVQITKTVDNEEAVYEQDENHKRNRERVPVLAASVTSDSWVPSSAIKAQLEGSSATEASDVSSDTINKVHTLMVDFNKDVNIRSHKHDGKLVAGQILLKNGQELSMKNIQAASKFVKPGYSKPGEKRGRSNAGQCAGLNCKQDPEGKEYCAYHYGLYKDGKPIWRQDGTTATIGEKKKGKGKGKGKKGKGKGKGDGKGKGKTIAMSATDKNNKVQTFHLNMQTMDVLHQLKEGDLQAMTGEQSPKNKRLKAQADLIGLINN